MSWLFLTAISVVFRSVYGIMTKVLSNKVEMSVYTQAMLLSLAAAFISFLLSPFLGGIAFDLSQTSLIILLLVVIPQGLGNIVYFESIKYLTNGTAQIAFSSILFFNTALALLFLNLHLNFMNVFGILLLALAIFTVISGKIKVDVRGILLMIFSAFLFSIFQLASAEISKQVTASTYLFVSYFGSALVVFLLKGRAILKNLSNLKIQRSVFAVPLLTAIPSLGNFLFAYYAYRTAPEPAKVAMLLTSQVVLTVVLSYFFLNEKSHVWRKIIGAILVVVSAILIKM